MHFTSALIRRNRGQARGPGRPAHSPCLTRPAPGCRALVGLSEGSGAPVIRKDVSHWSSLKIQWTNRRDYFSILRLLGIPMDTPETATECLVRDEEWLIKQVSVSGNVQCKSQNPRRHPAQRLAKARGTLAPLGPRAFDWPRTRPFQGLLKCSGLRTCPMPDK
jgi:hypothetical protein